jgi:hypothetical protein
MTVSLKRLVFSGSAWYAVTLFCECKPDALTAELTALAFRFYETDRNIAREKLSFWKFAQELF